MDKCTFSGDWALMTILVTYCDIGMQATVPYFAARLAGREVKLYDGSFEKWSAKPELPIN